MSTYPIVSREDVIDLTKLSERQKNQRILENCERLQKQSNDERIAECIKHTTEKVEKVNKITKEMDFLLLFQDEKNEVESESVIINLPLLKSFIRMNAKKNVIYLEENSEVNQYETEKLWKP